MSDLKINGATDQTGLLRKHEVASMFHVCERTIDFWRTHRGLPFVRVGRGILFRREAVRAFIEEREQRHA